MRLDAAALAEARRCATRLGRRAEAKATGETDESDDRAARFVDDGCPGGLRKAAHVVRALRVLILHLERTLDEARTESSAAFVADLRATTGLEPRAVAYLAPRLDRLLRALDRRRGDGVEALRAVAAFGTRAAAAAKGDAMGFAVVRDPPRVGLACLDASLAFAPVLRAFRTVVVASSAAPASPLFKTLLGFADARAVTIERRGAASLLPLVVAKGSDQLPLSTRAETRKDRSTARTRRGTRAMRRHFTFSDRPPSRDARFERFPAEDRSSAKTSRTGPRPREAARRKRRTGLTLQARNYGHLVAEACAACPDGVVALFPSFGFMEHVVATWDEIGVLRRVLAHKLVFLETADASETAVALEAFRAACDCGRGACFLAVARGGAADHIAFDRHYGRCVVFVGVPFLPTADPVLRARLDFLLHAKHVREADFLAFDAARATAATLRLRGKLDYGVCLLADSRFARRDKRAHLPTWAQADLQDHHLALSSDAALDALRTFAKQVAQPHDDKDPRAAALTHVPDAMDVDDDAPPVVKVKPEPVITSS